MNIDRLLRKRKYTGKEAGQVLLHSLGCDVRHLGDENYDPPIKQADLDRVQERIMSTAERTAYNRYVLLYRVFTDLYNFAHLIRKQFDAGYYHLMLQLREAQFAAYGCDLGGRDRVYTMELLEAFEELRAQINAAREQDLLLSFRRIRALNALFVHMAKFLDVPALTALQVDENVMEHCLTELNRQHDLLEEVVGERADAIFPQVLPPEGALSGSAIVRAEDFSLFDQPTASVVVEIGG